MLYAKTYQNSLQLGKSTELRYGLLLSNRLYKNGYILREKVITVILQVH